MNKIERLIDNKIKLALKGKQAFYENLQLAYEIFVSHYNKELNHNSKPLLDILKASGKDITIFKEYVINSTNIEKLSISNKGGLLLTFKGEFTFNNDYIDSNKWYDIAIDKDKKAIKELDDKSFYARLNSLLKAVEGSNKLTIDKESIKKALQPLATKTKTALDFAKIQ